MGETDFIQLYVAMRKDSRDPKFKIFRNDFLSAAKIKRHEFEKQYKSWTNFKREADEAFLSQLSSKQRALLSEHSKTFDPNATKDKCIEDLRLVQKENWGTHITRNFYRTNGKYSDSTWNRHFGTFQEFRRQAGLELNRHQAAVERSIAKSASIDHYKEFFKTNVLPYYNKYEMPDRPYHIKKIMVASDLHDKEVCEFTLSIFIEQCNIKQPDVIILNGDVFDLIEFGKYNVDLRHIDIKGRFDFVKERVFAPLRAVCPTAQIDLIAGNHEMRLLKLLADATPNVRVLLSDVLGIGFAEIFGLEEFKINWASKFDLGAYSKSDMKNEIKKNYRIYYNSFVASHIPDKRLESISGTNGHHHTGQLCSYAYVDPLTHLSKRLTWSQTPGMHVPDAEYLGNLPAWNTGFLEVTINATTCEAIQKIHYTHDSWTEIDGHLYENIKKD